MNTTAIVAAIIALLGGFVAGNALNSNEEPAVERITSQNREHFMSENPPAQDFVSARPGIAALPEEALSFEEAEGLLFMREEEKLARDVYQTLYETWGLPVFANIAQSEQTHTEAVRDLIEKYDLADPVTDDTIGVFKNETLAQLYTDLITRGKGSEVAALTVGATIEDLDIKDLQDRLAQTDNQDITLVYENLMRGSRNHLRSFTKQLTVRGETYEPQYISSSDYESIISGEQETGMGSGGNMRGGTQDGSGQGRGGGNRGWGGGGGQGGNR